MRRRTKAGTSKNHGGARKGGRQRRIPFARRAEELAAGLGIMVRRAKVGRKRPLRTERGGESRTRSVSADTRGMAGAKITVRRGRKIGLGRKRVRPA
jgi:hypothetical protein